MDDFGYTIFVFVPLLAALLGGTAWAVQARANRKIDMFFERGDTSGAPNAISARTPQSEDSERQEYIPTAATPKAARSGTETAKSGVVAPIPKTVQAWGTMQASGTVQPGIDTPPSQEKPRIPPSSRTIR